MISGWSCGAIVACKSQYLDARRETTRRDQMGRIDASQMTHVSIGL